MELIYLPQDVQALLVAPGARYNLVTRSTLASGFTLCGRPDELDGAAVVLGGIGALDAGHVCGGCCRALASRWEPATPARAPREKKARAA